MQSSRPVIEALVDIRLLLEEGINQSGSSLAHDRLRCVITLDAAVERAAFFSAHYLQIEITAKNEKLENLLGLLAGRLGGSWRFQGRGDLIRLHSARNKGQHEGLYPAQEHMSGFLAATEAGVSSLILAVTDVDVSRVTLSNAIQDSELRASMERAEAALTEKSYGSAVALANEALKRADSAWRRRRAEAGMQLPRSPNFTNNFQEFQEISKSVNLLLDNLRDVTDATAFATNPGELLWFRHLVHDVTRRELPPTEQETRRAVSFVFEWILRYEQLSSSLLTNRQATYDAQRRRVRRERTTPAHIASVSTDDASEYSVSVLFEIADVPAEAEFELWRFELAKLLGRGGELNDTLFHWRVEATGNVSLLAYPRCSINRGPGMATTPPTAEEKASWLISADDLATKVSELRTALLRVDEAVRQSQQIALDLEKKRLEEDRQLSEIIHGRLPRWVQDVRWQRDHLPAPEGVRAFRVLPAVALDEGIAQLIRARSEVSAFYGDGTLKEPAYVLILADGVEDLIDVLEAVSEDVDKLVQSKVDRKQAFEAWKAGLQERLEDAVRAAGGTDWR